MRSEVMIDAFAGLVPGGGIGRYVRDLSAALLTRPDAPPARFAHPRNFRDRARSVYPPGRLHEIPHSWWQLRMLYTAAIVTGGRFDRMMDHPAVYHSPVGYGPTFKTTRLIAHVHDLTFIEHPEWHPFRANMFLRYTIPHAARNADVVFTHSKFVAGRVVDGLGVPARRIVTIPPPLGHGFRPVAPDAARARVRRRFGIEGEFVLHVSTLEPRKNQVGLVAAFERMRRAGFRGPLVIVGQDGWRVGPIQDRIDRSPEANAIMRVRDADDDDLVALYGACVLCAYPSIEEGFGMPLLESLACGAVCVTSDHAALLELADGLAVHVPARDDVALAEAMITLWRDPDRRAALSATGPPRASHYSFKRWTERMFAFYREQLAIAAGRSAG